MVMLFTDGLYEVEGPQSAALHPGDAGERRAPRGVKLPAPELFDELLAEIKEFALGQDFMDDVLPRRRGLWRRCKKPRPLRAVRLNARPHPGPMAFPRPRHEMVAPHGAFALRANVVPRGEGEN